ncbi:MAG TPA: DNA repair exonuclease [Trueperaceae bacterium]
MWETVVDLFDNAPSESSASLRLLCAADIHLGRQPSRVRPELLGLASTRTLSPATAWFRLVEMAISERVEAVVLAGDVVEQNDDFYEAYADLRTGVERLAQAGIAVVGVAGNHDLDVLPRLARAVPGFTLLGEGGEWEALTVEGPGGLRVHLVGWSFPAEVVAADPLRGLPERRPEPTVGILHCDRDGSDSRYAPVSSAALAGAEVDAWLLGHVHKPDPMTGDRPIGYLGSITGMDPGEAGARGAWMLTISPAGRIEMEHHALAPLRWETVEVPVDALDHPDEVHVRISAAIDELHEELARLPVPPSAVGVRLILIGRSRHGDRLRRALEEVDPRAELLHRSFGISYFVHDVRFNVLPAVDLAELARDRDPVGLMAARLLTIRGERDPGEREELLRAARSRLEQVGRRKQFQAIASSEQLSEDRLAEIIEAAALRALDQLLAQKESLG